MPSGFDNVFPALLAACLASAFHTERLTPWEDIMAEKLSILGFAGSLRQGSYNRALLRAAQERIPSGATLTVFDLAGIPPFN